MPKKTRKMKQRAAERRSSLPPQMEKMPTGAAAPTAEPTTTTAPIRTRTDFAASRVVSPITYDYSHIYSDLKRIAVFAGFFFAVLIALSFVIK